MSENNKESEELVYTVFRKGIYKSQCGGIFTTADAAEVAAVCLRDGESDDYHSYEVVPFMLNTKAEQVVAVDCKLIESEPVIYVGCKTTVKSDEK